MRASWLTEIGFIRHGYPMIFFDRQWLLRLLADGLKYPEKVLLQKRVSQVQLLDDGVKVLTKDGDAICGDLVVGADGIHSVVREEMFRLASKLEPGYFSAGETESVPCYYKCSFGIAEDVPDWKYEEQHFVLGKGISQLIVSGPKKRIYWFLFVKLPGVKYGKDIPRYTKEDEAEFVKKYSSLPITETITFGHLYENRITSTLTALHEVVYKKWFFKRIGILGDAAHKVS
jgi:2-polyprenyl-6-methoxyphenol hydroxylase-like FAD-dependent oxidoreductase